MACSDLQLSDDRGELSERDGDAILTKVRYTNITEIEYFDVIWDGAIVRVTAEVIGTHEHTFDEWGHCADCHTYNEDFDQS